MYYTYILESIRMEMQPGGYDATLVLYSTGDSTGEIVGTSTSSFTINNTSGDIFVYVPLNSSARTMSTGEIANVTRDMESGCGINTFMEEDIA